MRVGAVTVLILAELTSREFTPRSWVEIVLRTIALIVSELVTIAGVLRSVYVWRKPVVTLLA